MTHLVLLGDSIFDNAAYTSGGPDVCSQVKRLLPPSWNATLLAVDGSTTINIPGQMDRLPNDATHLILSVGGNDALTEASRLGISPFNFQSPSPSPSLSALADISDTFALHYRQAIAACLNTRLPLAVCTIYNGCFFDPFQQRIASTALTIFNDVIIRVAIEHSLPIIDLRPICSTPADYANPIEPSSIGGEKIAKAIVALVTVSASARGTRLVSGA